MFETGACHKTTVPSLQTPLYGSLGVVPNDAFVWSCSYCRILICIMCSLLGVVHTQNSFRAHQRTFTHEVSIAFMQCVD